MDECYKGVALHCMLSSTCRSSVEWASGEVERENVPLDLIGLLWRGLLGYDLQEFDLEH